PGCLTADFGQARLHFGGIGLGAQGFGQWRERGGHGLLDLLVEFLGSSERAFEARCGAAQFPLALGLGGAVAFSAVQAWTASPAGLRNRFAAALAQRGCFRHAHIITFLISVFYK